MTMDARSGWLVHALARHISEHTQLPDNLWLLAHQLELIVVGGAAPTAARSLGSVVLARPEDASPPDLAAIAQRALDDLQDLVVSASHHGWPQESGRLVAAASIHDHVLYCGYLPPGADVRAPHPASAFVLPPFVLNTPGRPTTRVAG